MKLKSNKKYPVTNDDQNIIEEDYIEQCIGSFGVWQAIVCVAVASTRFIALWSLLSVVFLTPTFDFTCVKFRDNATVDVTNSTCYENCIKYEYTQSVFDSTLITAFGLICEKAWRASFTQTVLMLGVFAGSSLFGWVSDRSGRRTGLRVSTFMSIISTLAATYSPNYWTFTCFRFFDGVSSGGILAITTVYVFEIVGSKYREVAGGLAVLPDGLAQASLAAFAYYSFTWDLFMFKYWAVSVLIFLVNLQLPESPRWLVSKGKVNKAVELLIFAAKCNKLSDTNIKRIFISCNNEIVNCRSEVKSWNYIDFFRTRELTVKIMCMTTIFTAAGICYYGTHRHVTFLGTNEFVAAIVLGLIQVPFCLFSTLINKLFGRKITSSVTFLVTGLLMIVLTFIPKAKNI